MQCKIDHVVYVDDKDRIHWIKLEIDDRVFFIDKEDVLELQYICETALDRMVDVKEALYPIDFEGII